MGLNFCIKKKYPTNDTTKTFSRLRRDVRRISYWFNNPQDNSDYNPNLYISLNKWFDEAHPLIEEGINHFEAEY
jgi:hypothetical protein